MQTHRGLVGRFATATGLLFVAVLVFGAGAVRAAELGGARQRKWRVEDPTVSQEWQRNGARLIADYGSYHVLEAPDAVTAPWAKHPKVQSREDFNVIELHARRLNTAEPQIQARRIAAAAPFEGKRLHLVHFAGPVKSEWREALAGSGVKIVTYLPRNAYLVYGDAPALGRMQRQARDAAHVQWEGEYLDEFKIHPRAQALVGKKGAGGEDLFAVQLVADTEANAATLRLIDGLKRAPIVRQNKVLTYLNVIVRVPPEKLGELAARPDVVFIAPYAQPKKFDERQAQIVAGNLSSAAPSGPGYLAWLTSKGFSQAQFAASAFAVDVSDSGVDNGTQRPGHFGLYAGGQTGLASRVVYNRLLGSSNVDSTIQGCDGHGTINAHIIGGFSDRAGFPFRDSAGYSYGLGIAPFVRVGSSVIFDPDTFTNPNYTELQSRAYADGARISANSWGADTAGEYDVDAQTYDALVRDAQPTGAAESAPGNQQMVIVFAAGNAGPGDSTIGSPGTAKNVLSVGATENVHSHAPANGGTSLGGTDGCGTSDVEADSANDMAVFSSRGPCADGRAKPDLVAPGTHITGGVAQRSSPGANGSALECFRGSGVCALNGGGTPGAVENFFPQGQEFYTTSSGTSHSTPAVAGGAALLRQYFINRGMTPPSPAMTKAWLLNAARYLDGDGANDTLPSTAQGFGDMNLGAAFDGAPRFVRDELPPDKFTASGQTRTFVGTVTDTNQPLRVTLAWTDAPGAVMGNAYNNNLDLTVVIGGQTYRGNVFNGAFSVSGGDADPRNNVESVFLPAGLSGGFIVTVTAVDINSDGVPNDADSIDQDFALVIYNAAPNNGPVLATGMPTLGQEDCAPPNGVVDPGERVTVSVPLINLGHTPTTNLIARLLTISGVAEPSVEQSYGVVPTNGAAVTRDFSFRANGPCGGTVHATLRLLDGGADLGTVAVTLRLGTSQTNTANFAAAARIAVPTSSTAGAGSPYPSVITVSGVAGLVAKVTVTLFNFSHTYPSDTDFVLVSPSGRAVTLMSSAGGGSDVNGVTLTFDDAAAGSVEEPIVTGAYRPTAAAAVTLPAPAPPGPYARTLSALNGSEPNGAWRLYAADHATEDVGEVANGWRLTILTTDPQCCLNPAFADMAVRAGAAPDPVAVDGIVSYTFAITNRGPANAPTVTLTNPLPAGAVFLSANPSQGTCANDAGVVRCDFGALAARAGATVTMNVRAVSGTGLTNRVSIGAGVVDHDLSDNVAQTITRIVQPQLTANAVALDEGDSPSTPNVARFEVGLFPASTRTITVHFATSNGTAIADSDFAPASGLLTFAPGQTNQTVSVTILADTNVEPNETFTLALFDPVNALVGTPAVAGTILNDDFVFAALPFFEDWESGEFRPEWTVTGAGPFRTRVSGEDGPHGGLFHATLDSRGGLARNELTLVVDLEGWTNVVLRFWAISFGDEPNAPPSNPFVGSANFDGVAISTDGRTWYEVQGLRQLDPFYTEVVVDLDAAITEHRLRYSRAFRIRFNQFDNFDIPADGIGLDDIRLTGQRPGVIPAGSTLVKESCAPANDAIDPGELVTVRFALRNTSASPTTNLVATLLAVNGVLMPSASQNFGALRAGETAVEREFSFIALGECGGTVRATLQLQDGTRDLGTVEFPFALGRLNAALAQNFDSVTPPQLPAGWTTTASEGPVRWTTTSTGSDSPPNAAFVPDAEESTDVALTSPSFQVGADGAVLRFRHRFDTEECCDFARLEISIASGAFREVLEAGGTFLQGGYAEGGSWAGSSGGFMTTRVELPSAAAGRSVRLRWRFTSDESVGARGWFVDNVEVGGSFSCCRENDVEISVSDGPDPVEVGGLLTNTLRVGNSGPLAASGLVVTNFLPSSVTFVSAQTSQGHCDVAGGLVICQLGDLGAGASATIHVVTTPRFGGTLTNIAVVTRPSFDVLAGNNVAQSVTRVREIASMPFMEDWESGVFRPFWEVTGTGPFRSVITPNGDPHGGNQHLTMDSHGGNARNEVTLAINLAGWTNVMLRFWAVGYGEDPTGPPESPFLSGSDFDGVALSTDGMIWYEVQPLRDLIGEYGEYIVALDDTLAAHGLGYGRRFFIRFNQFDDASVPGDGIGIDDISLTGQRTDLTLVSVRLVAESCAPANGAIDPGEHVTVSVTLTNRALAATTDLVATLLPTAGIVGPNGPQSFGRLEPGGPSATRNFTFTAVGPCGGRITPTFHLADGATDLDRLQTSMDLGQVTSATTNFQTDTSIVIPSDGPATPYPSTITVSGLTGRIDKVTVTLHNLSHGYPPDIDAWLVGPRGQIVMLMSDAGGGLGLASVTLTFDETASARLPETSAIRTGTYRPTDYSPGDFRPSPAPTGPTGTSLSVFADQDPNGLWQLFINDDALNDSGQLAGGWQLTFTRRDARCCIPSTAADLVVSQRDRPDPAEPGELIRYLITVTNRGPAAATGAILRDVWPPALAFVSATSSRGTCAWQNGMVVCDLGTLPARAGAAITVAGFAPVGTVVTNLATAVANEVDLDPDNNTVEEITHVSTASTVSFAALGSIAIPSGGPGTPYPSTNLVTGVTGRVTQVTVTLSNLTHTYPDDLDILLVGPGGQSALLMSDAGGSTDVSNLTLVFDDAAATLLPDESALVAGTFRPTDRSIGDSFPSPAPAGPYGTRLGVFTGVNPNGIWRLFVQDDTSGLSGSIMNGWRIDLGLERELPRLGDPRFVSGNFTARFLTRPGRTYLFEFTSDLGNPTWELAQVIVGDGTEYVFTDFFPGAAPRFYRVRFE